MPVDLGDIELSVAIGDPVPLFYQGLSAMLSEHGFRVLDPVDPGTVNQYPEAKVVIITLNSAVDHEMMCGLRRMAAHRVIVALLIEPSPEAFLRALASGASAAVARDSSPGQILAVVEAAVHGLTVLPTEVLQKLTGSVPSHHTKLTNDQTRWLRELASGVTVAALGIQEGYSRREMFRRLRALYRHLGVENRAQALVKFAQLGLVD